MTIEFNCPHCDKYLKTGDEKAGLNAKCPQCGEQIEVPVTSEITDSSAGGDDAAEEENPYTTPPHRVEPSGSEDTYDVREDESNPYSSTDDSSDMKDCPMCGQSIKAKAVKCRYCGEEFGSPVNDQFQPGAPVDFGDVMSSAWAAFSDQMGICVGTAAVFMVVLIIFNFITQIPMQVFAMTMQQGGGPPEGGVMVVFGLIYVVTIVVQQVFQSYLMGGVTIVSLKVARGEEAEIGDLFGGGKYLLRILICNFLFGLMATFGMFLLCIPGFIVITMFWPVAMLIVDRDLPGIEGLVAAKDVTDGNWGTSFLTWFFAYLIAGAGFLLLCIGGLFTVPLASLMMSVCYLKLTGQRTVEPA